jgi:hypothetical protein
MPEGKFIKILSFSEKQQEVEGNNQFSEKERMAYNEIKKYLTSVLGLSAQEFKYFKNILRLSMGDRSAFANVLKVQEIPTQRHPVYESMFSSGLKETKIFRQKLEETFPKDLMEDICKIIQGSESAFVRFA